MKRLQRWLLGLVVGLGLLATSTGGWAQYLSNYPDQPYNGQDGPARLRDITWSGRIAGAGWSYCWFESDPSTSTYTGKTRCAVLEQKRCGWLDSQWCMPSQNKLCVYPDNANSNPLTTTGVCQTYVPPTVYQANVSAYLAARPLANGTLLPWPFSCTVGTDCDYINNTTLRVNGVVYRPHPTLAVGTALLRDGVPCKHLQDCIGMVNGRVHPYGANSSAVRLMPEWDALPGQAVALGIGANGAMWALAPDRTIWRWNGSGWSQTPGAGDRIAVDPNGNAYHINLQEQRMYAWNGAGWYNVAGSTVVDVAIGKNGQTWIVDGSGRMLQRTGDSSWTPIDGEATRIAIDGNGVLYHINKWGSMYRRVNNGWQQVNLPAGRYATRIAAGGDRVYVVLASAATGSDGTLGTLWNDGSWNLTLTQWVGNVNAVAVNVRGEPMVTRPVNTIFRLSY